MKKLRFLFITSILTLFALIAIVYASASTNIFDIKIDGKNFTVPAELGEIHIKDGRTMVPMRAFVQQLGWDVNWNPDNRQITVPYKNGNIIMQIDKNSYTDENGNTVDLDVPAYIVDSRTYLPLRALTEALGYKLGYEIDSLGKHKISIDSRTSDDTYTIMLYINGSDLEATEGVASDSIDEIIKSNTGENVNVVIETGGSTKWFKPEISSDVSQRHIVKGGKFQTVEADLGKRNMGESSTLSDFIKYSVKNYPADKYALILWSHGFGAIQGFGYDSLFENDGLTLPEFKTALADADTKFEFVGFDSCLMGSIETATIFKDYTDYLLVSEDLVSASSWEYGKWIKQLNSNPNIPTKELVKSIADSYHSKYGYSEPVLSLIDLTKIDKINEQLGNLADEFLQVIDRWGFEEFLNARYKMTAFGDVGLKDGPTDMLDIIYMAKKFDEYIYPLSNTEKLVELVKDAVYPNSPYGDKVINGLSVFFPSRTIIDAKQNTEIYKQIDFNSKYTLFVEKYTQMLVEYNEQFKVE